MTRSEPPADVVEDIVERLRADIPGFKHFHDGSFVPDIRAVNNQREEAADEIERLRTSSSLGGIEGGVQREDALTAGAPQQEKAEVIEAVARALDGNGVMDLPDDASIWSASAKTKKDELRALAKRALAARAKAMGWIP